METGEVHISISRNGDMQLYGHYDDSPSIFSMQEISISTTI